MIATEDRVHNGKLSKIERYGWTVQDEPGKFQTLSKMVLQFDESYQRVATASEPKIKRIAAEWSWIGCGTILVAYRDGQYYVIDGHHRVRAARRRSDIEHLPCLVFKTESAKQEAEGFIRHARERKPLTSADTFNALITAGDRAALEVKALLDRSGRSVRNTSKSPRAVKCVGLLVNYATSDLETLKRIWPLIDAIADGHPFNERIPMSLMYMEQHMPEGQSIMDKRWADRLLKLGNRGILDAAARAASFYARGGNKVFATGVVEAINKGLHQKLELQ